MTDFLKTVQNGIISGDPTIVGILVALFVVLLTILILVCRGGGNRRRGVLLVGLCDSGKTLLYSTLVDKRYVDTHTSVKENSGVYVPPNRSGGLRIIDLPGYERLRTKFLDQYKALARGIIFIIDSATLTKDIKEVGELLYTLLTDGVISSNHPPFLIVCNKQDQALAKGARVIQASLEKELDTLRKTQSAALEGTSNLGNNNVFLGRRNKQFEFADLKPLKVEFVEASIRGSKDSDPDTEDILQWLGKIA